jgi:integrase/recombinase XerD
MSVILRKRKNADGTTSLRLDIFHNGQRSIETLKNLQLAKPSNAMDRELNKQRLQQAEVTAVTRAGELEANNYNMVTDAGKKTKITAWMESYVDGYMKKDKRNVQGALNRFKAFLKENGKSNLTFGNLNALIIEDFIEYLESSSTGEGASSYYNRFRKMIRHAYRRKLLRENPLELVERKVSGKAKKKDILTLGELAILSSTKTESSEVRRAFLFSCVTGLRWCDVKGLKWGSINIKSRQMNLRHAKTGGDMFMNLNNTAIELLGEAGESETDVFILPSANGANKTLKAWVKRAGLQKAITWHNARHSFGTNLIYNDVDVLTASKLLGHTSMKLTQRYVDAANEMKEVATDKLNFKLSEFKK